MTIEHLHRLFLEHPIAVSDTRQMVAGSIFFALKGAQFNGNAFASQALKAGAAWVIVDEPQARLNDRCILVEDVLSTLQDLARFHRNQYQIPVIGITGTNGKTTTKELINSVLSSHFRTISTCGNLNNHIGVPLTLLKISSDTEVAIIEMGANHQGEIAFLCSLAQPACGIITNIGKAHLEGFGSYEGVIRAKSELYQFLENHHGTALVNHDDPLLIEKSSNVGRTTYGMTSSANCHGEIVSSDPFLSMRWKRGDQSLEIKTQIVGDYNAPNVLAAICAGMVFNVPEDKIVRAIAGYQPTNNRSQVIDTGRNLVIMDAYNANPTSMEAALRNFSRLQLPEKIAIIGDMLELGKETIPEHKQIFELTESMGFERVYYIGPVFCQVVENTGNFCFENSDKAMKWFKMNPLTGSTVMLKGSRSMRLELLMEVL
ncbi:MAG: UDP-N-acetylmuramoyl-tripeptide--D-alanyl-D-alanine ligase [Bacteroidetes bacterium]|nr:UDP-N-acetylmuramoyl-tripeptide--D-alanyl-D-alanine ligase [Bacteroidota bacterium]